MLIRSGSETSDDVTISNVGTFAKITRCEMVTDECYVVEVEGETRFVVDETFDTEPYLTGRVTPFWEQEAEPLELQPLYDQTVTLFRKYLVSLLSEENRHLAQLQMPQDPVIMSFAVAATLQTSLAEKQSLLELSMTSERLQHEIQILQREDLDGPGDEAEIANPAIVQVFTPLDLETVHENLSRN